MVGKTLDGFAPIGPYFVSADQVDPNNLNLETRVNGEVRQSVNTTKFIFNPQKLIAYTSRLFALEPGDIIFTGTPSGVIVGYPKEKQVWLKAGDKIESTIKNFIIAGLAPAARPVNRIISAAAAIPVMAP